MTTTTAETTILLVEDDPYLRDAFKLLLETELPKSFEKQVGIDAVDRYNWTPLLKTVTNGHVQVLEYLISKGASVEHKADGGWTAFHEAAFRRS